MMLSRRRFMTIAAGTAMAGSAVPVAAKAVSWRGIALGAEAKLFIFGLPEPKAERVIKQARAEIERLENIFSLYRSSSALSMLNANGRLQAPPPELLSLLSRVSAVHAATGGLFDPTVQPLWQAYAEHRGKPAEALIRNEREKVGWRFVTYNSRVIRFARPDMQLTLNGIAQGFITDRITALLRRAGLANAIVNIGEISAMGHKPGGDAWQIGLVTNDREAATDSVSLNNRCVATSTPMGTTFDGVNSHILSPLSGRPVESRWRRTSIVHDSAATADGLSTAAILMDEAQLKQCIETVGQVAVNARRSDGSLLEIR